MASDHSCSSSNSTRIGIDFSEMSGTLAITRDHLKAVQMADLSNVMELLATNESQARVLLMRHRWNVEKVFDAVERKGRERLFTETGVPCVKDNAVKSPPNRLTVQCEGDRSSLQCMVCFEDVDGNGVTTMECGHYFCNSCWTEHFITSIDNGDARRIRCMAIKCSCVCDDQTVHFLLSERDPLLASRFECLLMESYIDDNDKAEWCPSKPPCGRAILIGSHSDPFFEVECVCKTQFCFNCLSPAHSPCTCRIWGMWVKRFEAEKDNIDWIEANNTKLCPKCHNGVIKNGGCNTMTCKCGQRFCWLCGGAFVTSQVHSCNRFVKGEQKKPDRRAALSKGSNSNGLWRYMHYCKRYRSHKDSLEKETSLQQKIQTCSVLRSMQVTGRLNRGDNWVHAGFEKLLLARRVLTYTYPFAFVMFGDEVADNSLENKEIAKDLFEDQQQQLECCVEKLAVELERNIYLVGPDEVADLRLRIVSLSMLLDNCCKNMYECIEEELLPHLGSTEIIAPYKASGPEKANDITSLVRSQRMKCIKEQNHIM